MTKDQSARRDRFILGVNMGTATREAVLPFEDFGELMQPFFVEYWNAEDWPDMPAEVKNEITALVEEYRFTAGEPKTQKTCDRSVELLNGIKAKLTDNNIR